MPLIGLRNYENNNTTKITTKYILNGVGESRLDLVIDRYRLAFIEPSYIV